MTVGVNTNGMSLLHSAGKNIHIFTACYKEAGLHIVFFQHIQKPCGVAAGTVIKSQINGFSVGFNNCAGVGKNFGRGRLVLCLFGNNVNNAFPHSIHTHAVGDGVLKGVDAGDIAVHITGYDHIGA